MMEPPQEPQQACVACRNQKRKCDKAIPRCGLCARTGRDCDYSVRVPPSAANLDDLQARIAELEERLQAAVSLGGGGSSGGFGGEPSPFTSHWFFSRPAVPNGSSQFQNVPWRPIALHVNRSNVPRIDRFLSFGPRTVPPHHLA